MTAGEGFSGDWPYPVPVDDGGAVHLRPGVRLPALLLSSTGGGETDLSAVPGLGVVIVYPWTGRAGVENPPGWDDIAGAHGSTPQLEGFRDLWSEFKALGARLFAISRQAGAYQGELAGRLCLPFPILSDAAGRFGGSLGLPTFQAGGDIYLSRMIIIARDGAIADVNYPVHPPPDCARQTLERIGKLA